MRKQYVFLLFVLCVFSFCFPSQSNAHQGDVECAFKAADIKHIKARENGQYAVVLKEGNFQHMLCMNVENKCSHFQTLQLSAFLGRRTVTFRYGGSPQGRYDSYWFLKTCSIIQLEEN